MNLDHVDRYKAALEHLRAEAAMRATFLEKPAIRTRLRITSTSEDGGTQSLDGTSARRVGQVGPPRAEVQEAR